MSHFSWSEMLCCGALLKIRESWERGSSTWIVFGPLLACQKMHAMVKARFRLLIQALIKDLTVAFTVSRSGFEAELVSRGTALKSLYC